MEAVDKVVTQDMNDQLIAEVQENKIKKAVFQMNALKASGPDRYNGLFFQKYWEIIKDDVCKAVRGFFQSGHMLSEINRTNMVLIPKVQTAEEVNQFRPIGLCNFVYKIIAKIMVNRLKNMLGDLITENQAAFVPKRMIQDNIVIAHEFFHHLKRKKEGKLGELGLKIDMNKAYDRVEWDFLQKVMEKMGFNEIWINWIMQCIKTVKYNILVSGKDFGTVSPS